jgi:hypothetical protein
MGEAAPLTLEGDQEFWAGFPLLSEMMSNSPLTYDCTWESLLQGGSNLQPEDI